MERLYGFIGEIGDKNRCFALIDEPWNNLPATWVKKRLEAKQSNEYKKRRKKYQKKYGVENPQMTNSVIYCMYL